MSNESLIEFFESVVAVNGINSGAFEDVFKAMVMIRVEAASSRRPLCAKELAVREMIVGA